MRKNDININFYTTPPSPYDIILKVYAQEKNSTEADFCQSVLGQWQFLAN